MRLYRLPAPERRLAPMRRHMCACTVQDLTSPWEGKGREGRCPLPNIWYGAKVAALLLPCMVVVLHAFVIYMFLKDFYVIIF